MLGGFSCMCVIILFEGTDIMEIVFFLVGEASSCVVCVVCVCVVFVLCVFVCVCDDNDDDDGGVSDDDDDGV